MNQNFENLDFLLLSLSKFGHFTTMLNQFQKMRPVLQSVFTQEFNFDSQNFIASFLENSIFSAYDAQKNLGYFKIMINPLVNWVWIGGIMMVIGSLFAFWPSRRKM